MPPCRPSARPPSGLVRPSGPLLLLAVLLLLGLVLGLVLGARLGWRDDSLQRLSEARRVRIGYAVEAPYAWVDGSGRVTGESPELARQVLARLAHPAASWQIDWVQLEFDRLVPELLGGRIDLIASGLFATPERARVLRFSRPTLIVAPGLLLRAGVPMPAGWQALAAGEGLRVAVLSGSAEQARLQRLGRAQARPAAQAHAVQVVPDASAGLALLRAGQADALLLSWPTVRQLAMRAGEGVQARRFDDPTQPDAAGQVAFAFRPGDAALARAWDLALAPLIGSPEHRRLLRQQGFGDDDLPSPG